MEIHIQCSGNLYHYLTFECLTLPPMLFYCSLFIYVLYVGVYMHIRKIIRLLKKGSEAIGVELSGPSFI